MNVSDIEPSPFDPNCPFCRIVTGQERGLVVCRWTDCVALSPLRPATLGHTLVVPVVHVGTVWNLDTQLAQSLAVRVLEVSVALRHTLNLDAMNIIQSNGAEATQTVPHLHVHIVPRYANDEMGAIWPHGNPVDERETEIVMTRLSELLAK